MNPVNTALSKMQNQLSAGMDRREFAKLSSLAIAALLGPLSGFTFVMTGCGIADVIASLNIGISVLTAAAGVSGLNPSVSKDLTKVSKILSDITGAYNDYEKAEATLKPGKLSTLEAAIMVAQADLSQILADTGVKNPELVSYITTAVAVANSAIMALVAKLGNPTLTKLAAARGLNKPLPTIPNAKSAKDLKKAWNDAVKSSHPEAVIQ